MSAETEQRSSTPTPAMLQSEDRVVHEASVIRTRNANLHVSGCVQHNNERIGGERSPPNFLSSTIDEGGDVFEPGVIESSPFFTSHERSATSPNNSETIPTFGSSSLSPELRIPGFGEEKHSENLNSGTSPTTFHPRVVNAGPSSVISTPVGSTFSISSRGYTSATAPSTTSSSSSTASASTNQTRTRNNATTATMVANHQQQPFNPNGTTSLRRLQQPTSNFYQPQAQPKQPAVMTTIPAITTPPACGTVSTSDENGNTDRVDSALLSALCDQRERKGLLRLEQVLIDFMNERHTGFIEVGGPNNSIVIGGQTGGRLSQANGEEIRGRQTSFQRLCLHRLADRFNIVRESSSTTWTPSGLSQGEDFAPAVNCPSPSGAIVPGLIRLVKVKNSRIPPNLLIDLDVERIDSARGDQAEASMRSTSDNLAQTNVTPNGDVVVVGKRGNQQPKRKMMIMKRGNKSRNGHNSDRGSKSSHLQSSGRNSMKGKNLSDKEKAYAEARARIFKDDQENSEKKQNVSATTAEAASLESTAPPRALSRLSTTSSTRSESPEMSSCKVGSDSLTDTSDVVARVGSLLLEPSTLQDGHDADSSPKPQGKHKENQVHGSNAAASSTNGALSKVIWRNRRQEENDPDFRRGVIRGAGNTPSFSTMSQMHYGGAHGSGVFVAPGQVSATSSFCHQNNHVNDSSYGMMQQNHLPKNMATNVHYQHHYYNSASQIGSHQFSSNASGHRHSHMNSQQQGANGYYHHQSNLNGNMYFSQHNQDQSRQHFHQASASNSRGSYIASNAQGIHQSGMFYNSNNNANGGTGRRSTGAAIYNMEEFPALR